MRFEILGPLRVHTGAGSQLVIRSRRERALLAILLLHSGDTVPAARLVEAIWNARPPVNARNQVQGCVSRLRKLLAGGDYQRPCIITDPAGYRAALVESSELDLWEFRQLGGEARRAAGAGGAEAAQRYRTALALWRGSALADVDSDLLRPIAAALDEERLQLLEECIQVELDLGRTGALVGELSELTSRYPYREGLHAALMQALYRTGRQADALAAYRHARQALRDELGTEPTRQLQELHQAILKHDPALGPPAATQELHAGRPRGAAPPRELPPAITGFTGRSDVLDALDQRLDNGPSKSPAVMITVLTGTAGVGKTALAVHWAHRVADRFPDGQLYLNLRGHSAVPPLAPTEAISALLRSLGTPPEQIPTDPTEAAARFRSLLAGKRVLLLLDDAETVEQVRSLLPGSPGCFVLVTSRNRLAGLVARDGAWPLGLEVFTPDEAASLLAQLLGAERVEAEAAAARALGAACAYLPLALRIAAASVIGRPHQTLASYVAELSSGDRLAALRAGDDQESAVQTALARSYRALPEGPQRLFRLLGLVPGPDFTAAAAAALADTSTHTVIQDLDRLAVAHLISEPSAGRYTFHDLLRLYAIRLCQTEDSELERAAAVERLLDTYLRHADAAATLLHPIMVRLPLAPSTTTPETQFDQPADALAWFDAERANLVAATVCAGGDRPRLAWLLADRLRGYFSHGRHTGDWLTTAQLALTAAERDGDAKVMAAAQLNLAHLHACLADYPAALTHYSSAGQWAGQAGWDRCRTAALSNLGSIYLFMGQLAQSADHLAGALRLSEERQDRGGQAATRVNLGVVERERGRLWEAEAHLTRSLAWTREQGYQHGEAAGSDELARTLLELGRLDDAEQAATRAVDLYRETGDRGGEVAALDGLADVHDTAGRPRIAVEVATRGTTLAATTGDTRGHTDALNALGRARLHCGEVDRAIEHHRHALELARHAGIRRSETVSLVDLATAQAQAGEWMAAAELARAALHRARDAGYRIIDGQALMVLAEVRLHELDYSAARDHAANAIDCHRTTGCRLREAQALTVLGRIQHATGDQAEADRSWRAARELYQAAGGVLPATRDSD